MFLLFHYVILSPQYLIILRFEKYIFLCSVELRLAFSNEIVVDERRKLRKVLFLCIISQINSFFYLKHIKKESPLPTRHNKINETKKKQKEMPQKAKEEEISYYID